MKCYLPAGNGILIVTAVWAFSACEQNNWIILEVILLFRRLTRTVQPVSGEPVCLKGLKVWKWAEASSLTQTMLTERDVMWDRQRALVPPVCFACVIRTCVSGGWVSWCTYYLLTLQFEKRLQQSSTASIWYSIRAASAPALIRNYLCLQSLAFILSVSVFVLCENQSESHAVLPTGHSEGSGLQQLASSWNDECAVASLTEDLFSTQQDTKRKEAFNANATICITWNCHFHRK